MRINAKNLHFRELNEIIRNTPDAEVTINNCTGQRYIGCGLKGKNIAIYGTPGNGAGAYLDGSTVRIMGNAQDATGDTMNDGTIYIHGSCGDACGYAMRGGKIFIRGDAGYRTGIHMKQYKDKKPVLVVGGRTGSFLGEYLAGGTIIILGLHNDGRPIVGNFCGTGMHGGEIYLRCPSLPEGLPRQVIAREADKSSIDGISSLLIEFCDEFGEKYDNILNSRFYHLSPDTRNPYRQLYSYN
ncbi:MAG: glutamate synthase [Bacillota bacterium]